MILVAHAIDKPGSAPRRLAALEAHRAYLDTAPSVHGVTILMSGPLQSDDGSRMVGSFFLLKAASRDSVDTMFAADPMALADVWETLSIHRVHVRMNAVGPLEESA